MEKRNGDSGYEEEEWAGSGLGVGPKRGGEKSNVEVGYENGGVGVEGNGRFFLI